MITTINFTLIRNVLLRPKFIFHKRNLFSKPEKFIFHKQNLFDTPCAMLGDVVKKYLYICFRNCYLAYLLGHVKKQLHLVMTNIHQIINNF